MKLALRIMMVTGVLLCVAQVLLPAYYLTGDGPCHVYNARMLHDKWAGGDWAFFSKFYLLNDQPDPNWLTHILLALLQFLMSGTMAEKVMLAVYVLLFAGGFSALMKKLNPHAELWPLVLFVFVFQHTLVKGFYNFSLSIAFFSWFVWAWLTYLEKKGLRAILVFALFAGLTFFSHALAFVFGCVTCGALTMSYSWAGESHGSVSKGRLFVRHALVLLLSLAPFLFLFWLFAGRHSGDNPLVIRLEKYRVIDLLHPQSLVTRVGSEEFFANWIARLLMTCFTWWLVVRLIKDRRVHKYDGLLLVLFFAAFVYLFFPDQLLGGGLLVVRAQLLVLVLLFCCTGYLLKASRLMNALSLLFFGCFVCMVVVQSRSVFAAAEGVKDIVAAMPHVKDHSVVLPLSFSHSGKDKQGGVITERNWVFGHAAQYMGAVKPLILLDNYEANTGYFPFIWRPQVNPYANFPDGGSFELQPPYAQPGIYTQRTGVRVDYILLWCFDSTALADEHVRKLCAEMAADYNKIYTSPSGRTILYEKR